MTTVIGKLPTTLPVFPLTGALMLPGSHLPLNIFEPRYLKLIDDVLAGDRMMGMVQPRKPETSQNEPPVYDIGCMGKLVAWQEADDNRYVVTLQGLCRFRIERELDRTTPYRLFNVSYDRFADDLLTQDASAIDRDRLMTLVRAFVKVKGYQVNWDVIEAMETETLIDATAVLAPFTASERQALLEAPNMSARGDMVMTLLAMAVNDSSGSEGTLQ